MNLLEGSSIETRIAVAEFVSSKKKVGEPILLPPPSRQWRYLYRFVAAVLVFGWQSCVMV
jgi:hypothetical protein